MSETLFLEKMAEILEEDVAELSMSTQLDELDTWDSLSILTFNIFALDTMKKKINGSDVKKAKVIRDLWELLNAKEA